MATYLARRANKILKIDENAVDRYLAQGYTITDVQGNLVKKGTPRDTIQLTAEYKKQEEEIAGLKSENEALKAEVKALKAELTKIKSETPVSVEPKTTRKRKQATEEDKAE